MTKAAVLLLTLCGFVTLTLVVLGIFAGRIEGWLMVPPGLLFFTGGTLLLKSHRGL